MVDCHWEMYNDSAVGFSITFIPSVTRKNCSVLKTWLIRDFLFLMYSSNFFWQEWEFWAGKTKNQNCKSGRGEMRHKLKKYMSDRSDNFWDSWVGKRQLFPTGVWGWPSSWKELCQEQLFPEDNTQTGMQQPGSPGRMRTWKGFASVVQWILKRKQITGDLQRRKWKVCYSCHL